jgi:hypothetical protein
LAATAKSEHPLASLVQSIVPAKPYALEEITRQLGYARVFFFFFTFFAGSSHNWWLLNTGVAAIDLRFLKSFREKMRFNRAAIAGSSLSARAHLWART